MIQNRNLFPLCFIELEWNPVGLAEVSFMILPVDGSDPHHVGRNATAVDPEEL